ncbi:multiple epidermal growth factor-like domains protein 10 [Ostrea edulis]|uniref:multiple epidermal growth factor-like domains protein 10 n=1 Tax=Ostrea edulis TaxID=37623 RepID=UPI0024AF6E5F|nr:multiple epidermal growth factor-like domains protein 10 [Ostrea edulis]
MSLKHFLLITMSLLIINAFLSSSEERTPFQYTFFFHILTGIVDNYFNYTVGYSHSGLQRISANSTEVIIPFPHEKYGNFYITFNLFDDEIAEMNDVPVLLCEIEVKGCPRNQYGSPCRPCPVQCDKCYAIDGSCVCQAGYKGENCTEECSNSTYGVKCVYNCGHCINGTCDHVTGNCLIGCDRGWTTSKCNTACSSGWYGQDCVMRCNGHCITPHVCDHVTGSCRGGCATGWTNDACDSACSSGWYGQDCGIGCSSHCITPHVCDHVTGYCLGGCATGWTNDTCDSACSSGWYGQNCTMRCSSNCITPHVCDHVTGSCLGGCATGWTNDTCDSACSSGWYGHTCVIGCSSSCITPHVCDHVTGYCVGGCATGWTGDTCDSGWYFILIIYVFCILFN